MSNLHWQHIVTRRNTFFFLNIEQSPSYFRYEPLYQVGKKIGQKPLQWRYIDTQHQLYPSYNVNKIFKENTKKHSYFNRFELRKSYVTESSLTIMH